jgi:hypothetical protein
MFVRIKKNIVHSFVFVEESDSQTMNVVGYFLTDDVHRGGGKDWIKFILESSYQDCTSNYSFMEKEDGNIVLGCILDEDPYDRALTVPISVMIDLLEQWDMICKMNPDEVIITYDQDKFHVEGKIIHKQAQETVH